jgi:hypothetical protein
MIFWSWGNDQKVSVPQMSNHAFSSSCISESEENNGKEFKWLE